MAKVKYTCTQCGALAKPEFDSYAEALNHVDYEHGELVREMGLTVAAANIIKREGEL